MVTSLWLHPVPMEQALDTQWLVLLLQSSGRDSSPIRKQRFFFFLHLLSRKAESPSPFFVAAEVFRVQTFLHVLCSSSASGAKAWFCAGLQLSTKRAVLTEIPPSPCWEDRS